MLAFELWAVYAAQLIGRPVENAEEKFAALEEQEQLAWAAVAQAVEPK